MLRPFVDTDTDTVVRAYADPDIQQWHVQSRTPDEARSWIESLPAKWASETTADWLITDPDGTPRGRIGLRTIDFWDGQGEVAYWVLPDSRGRAVAPRALRVLADYLFGTVGLHRVVLRHSTQNQGSCRVAEKAGFAAEGVLRGDGWHVDGFHDAHLHARLATD